MNKDPGPQYVGFQRWWLSQQLLMQVDDNVTLCCHTVIQFCMYFLQSFSSVLCVHCMLSDITGGSANTRLSELITREYEHQLSSARYERPRERQHRVKRKSNYKPVDPPGKAMIKCLQLLKIPSRQPRLWREFPSQFVHTFGEAFRTLHRWWVRHGS